MNDQQYFPVWIKVLIVVMTLPVLGFLFLLSVVGEDATVRLLIWLYPAYVIVSAVCAWLSYPRRPEITWILLILMLVSHLGVYYLALVG